MDPLKGAGKSRQASCIEEGGKPLTHSPVTMHRDVTQ
jgi:hypothetical protein